LVFLPAGLIGAAHKQRVQENALLLMMVGTYTGWQVLALIVMVAVALKLFQAILALVWRGAEHLPFSLFLALATVLVLLGSGELSTFVQRRL